MARRGCRLCRAFFISGWRACRILHEECDQLGAAGHVTLPHLFHHRKAPGLDHVIGLAISAADQVTDRFYAPNQIKFLILAHANPFAIPIGYVSAYTQWVGLTQANKYPLGISVNESGPMNENRSKPDQYQLRFPEGMRDRLKEIAEIEGRSLNAEIIERLRKSLRVPEIDLPEDLAAEAWEKLPIGTLGTVLDEIRDFAVERFSRAIRDHDLSQQNLVGMLEDVIEYAPPEERAKLRKQLRDMLQRARLLNGPALDDRPNK